MYCLPTLTNSSLLSRGVLLATLLFGLTVMPVSAQVEPTPVPVTSTAAGVVGLMAIPPRIGEDGSLVIKPGGTVQLEARVRNTSDRTVSVRSLAEDFIIGDDGLTPMPVEELTSSRWSLAQWIQITTPVNEILPGESVTIPFIVQVPADALPGGRYAMVMHQVEGATTQLNVVATGGQTGINQRVGTLVYLRVDGPITEDANIRNLTAPSLVEYGPVPLSFEVENLSDIHIRPVITVSIKNWLGTEVDSLNLDTKNIFPFSQREFAFNWEHMWGFGRYSVDVNASYGTAGKVAIASTTFWMIPYTMIIGGLILILAGIAVIMVIRRHMHHRNDVTRQHIALLEEKIKHLETELPPSQN